MSWTEDRVQKTELVINYFTLENAKFCHAETTEETMIAIHNILVCICFHCIYTMVYLLPRSAEEVTTRGNE